MYADVRPVPRFGAVTGNRQGRSARSPVEKVGDDVAVSTGYFPQIVTVKKPRVDYGKLCRLGQ